MLRIRERLAKIRRWRPELKTDAVIIAVTIFILATDNLTFFQKNLAAYPPSTPNLLALISVSVALGSLLFAFLSILSLFRTKPALIAALLLASTIRHFTD